MIGLAVRDLVARRLAWLVDYVAQGLRVCYPHHQARSFKIRLLLNEGNKEIEDISSFSLCMIDYSKLDDIIKTIQVV